jgi:hypothetical protein
MAVTNLTKAEQIAAGYKTTGQALGLGSVVIDGVPFPEQRVQIPLSTVAQHGVVLGATGGGKTKTLQVMAEQLSNAGVPVVMADVKGDLQGLAQAGYFLEPLVDRAIDSGDNDWCNEAFPVEFVGLGADHGCVPIRASVGSFGYVLLGKVLGLNETQEAVLKSIFIEAGKQGFELNTLADLRGAISEIARRNDGDELGYISKATAGVILRGVGNLENDGGATLFGSPGFDPTDLMRIDDDGRGIITLFELAENSDQPAMFSVFLMWMLAQLGQILPEVGVVDKPKLVIVFDEAHLLFSDASKAFLKQLIRTVKLIRSKGVGVFFCSQSAKDIHPDVMEQLGLRVLHALRVRTPDARRALTYTVDTFPDTDVYDLAKTIKALRKGEAMVTVLTEDGGETPVAQTLIQPPRSFMGPISPNELRRIVKASELYAKYYREPEPEPDEEEIAASATEKLAKIGGYGRFKMPEPNFDDILALITPEKEKELEQ